MGKFSENNSEFPLAHAQIGSMVVIGGKMTVMENDPEIKLEFNHEKETFEIIIHREYIEQLEDFLEDENYVKLRFGPKFIQETGQIIKKFGFIYQVYPNFQHEFELHFMKLDAEQIVFLKELFTPLSSAKDEDSSSIVNIEEEKEEIVTQQKPRKRRLYTPDEEDDLQPVEHVDLTHVSSDKIENRKRKQEHPVDEKLPKPRKRQHMNSKNSNNENAPPVSRRTRKSSRDQKRNNESSLETTAKKRQTVEPAIETVSTRLTRNRTRANYVEENVTITLDDDDDDGVSEKKMLEDAIRLSMKTFKKENPNVIEVENVEKTVVDDEDWGLLGINKEQELFAYHTTTRGELTVKMEDFLCLARNEYLNDIDIDFYIQYILNEKMTEDQRKRTYVFATHFYSLYATSSEFSGWKNDENAGLKAVQKRYMRVQGIVGEENLFEKDFLIIPLNDRNHWFLAIVCFPGLEGCYTLDGTKLRDDELKKCSKKNDDSLPPLKTSLILILDSIAGSPGRKTAAVNHIRNFLRSEYDNKYKDSAEAKIGDLPGHFPRCPLQSNNVDCGCFLLEFLEQFFVTNPITNFRTPMHLENWFDPKDVGSMKRRELAHVFELLMGDSQTFLPPIKFGPDPPKIPTPELAETEDSSNNNDNNAVGNKEFNNNNFNCVDSNNALENGQNAETICQKISVMSEDDEMRAIKDNIKELIEKLPEMPEEDCSNECSGETDFSTTTLLKQNMLSALSDTNVQQNLSNSNINNEENAGSKLSGDNADAAVKDDQLHSTNELSHEVKNKDYDSDSSSLTVIIENFEGEKEFDEEVKEAVKEVDEVENPMKITSIVTPNISIQNGLELRESLSDVADELSDSHKVPDYVEDEEMESILLSD